jgi:hypothetical protein
MASGIPNLSQTPLWGSSTFNIGLNMPGMASGLCTQQQTQNQPKVPGAGFKAKKQVILEDDDDVSVLMQQPARISSCGPTSRAQQICRKLKLVVTAVCM